MVTFKNIRYDDYCIYAEAYNHMTGFRSKVKIDRETGVSNITRDVDRDIAKACVCLCVELDNDGKLNTESTICWG